MVSQKNLNFSIVLMVSICCTFFSPLSSDAQPGYVTLSVSEGAGVKGSSCCNPNYPDANKVEVILDNLDDNVGVLQVDICSADLGDGDNPFTDLLVLSGVEVAPRAEALDHTIDYNDISQCVEVRFSWTDSGAVYIAAGSGTVATLNFDVSEQAPNNNCPAGGDLTMSAVNVLNVVLGVLTVTEYPGEFCYYNCGSDLHCDDGIFCNGVETCLGVPWCQEAAVDPCSPLLCDEDADTCYCDDDIQCDDGLWCTGTETCNVGTGNCQATPPCPSDGDSCTDDCDEGTETCTYACTAAGPWDGCCDSSSNCVEACTEEVTLTIGDGEGPRSSTGNEVIVSLANQDDEVRAVQVEICDGDDYLTIQGNCVPSGRVPAGDYACQCNELPSGCAACTLNPNFGVWNNITTGTGPLFTVKYNVSGDAPFGQCRDLTVNTEGSFLVLSGKVCSEESSNPGASCIFDADCPGGSCISNQLVTMPVDGEFCVPCTSDPGCWDGNDCTTDSCVGGLCVNPNNTDFCNDGDPCTDYDQCRKPDIGAKNQCVGIDNYSDDGFYCNGVESCDGLAPTPCGTCNEGDDVCIPSDVTLTVENAYGREGVITIALENNAHDVGEVHLTVCDADQRSWLHLSAESCGTLGRAGAFNCSATALGPDCVGMDIVSNFPLDFIPTGTGAIGYLNYTVDPVTIPMDNYADLDPQVPDVKDLDAASLSVTPKPGRLYAAAYCEGDFNGDGAVDGGDVGDFIAEFGRSIYFNPCNQDPVCKADFNCDIAVDGGDILVFIEDFGRSVWSNVCPPLSDQFTCSY